MFHVPEKHRVHTGMLATTQNDGNNGNFQIPIPPQFKLVERKLGGVPRNRFYQVIASDGMGWEHVSVSLPNRCLTWDEMAYIKGLFWSAQDCVTQFHPPKTEYVNNHPYTLHLWRTTEKEIPVPPSILVGIK